ncbi:LAQU0S19e00298g1_1 [Lachancea quebecensis]|uniref:LAQU0S19e00298g1_1 n=1 Tax=Lachancea quebecensis TaxID=1654605 RepID=A0A0P1KXI6_9SACH|nr:LAQU0S19e00298g1_1 [Lachancea quebecensis]
MDYRRGDPWIEPHGYATRFFSLDEGIGRPGRDAQEPEISDPVSLGLRLVGSGLVKKPKKAYTSPYVSKARNFSTNDIKGASSRVCEARPENSMHSDSSDAFSWPSTSDSSSIFDPLTTPPDEVVEQHFRELLESRAFFWGSARSGLKNLSSRRKWQLVCKERLMRDEKDNTVRQQPATVIDETTIENLMAKLRSGGNAAASLYRLEKLLRRNDFSRGFLRSNGVAQLADLLPLFEKDDMYVCLRCFKTLSNTEEGRLSVVSEDRVVSYFCSGLIAQQAHLRVHLLSAELLLLCTYIESPGGSNTVLHHLIPLLPKWISSINSILKSSKNDLTNPDFIATPNLHQIQKDYCLTSLFLVNSLMQIISSFKEKLEFVKKLRELGIHQLFNVMHGLDYKDLDEEIEKYKFLEKDIVEKTNPELPHFLNISYGNFLSTIVQEAHHNPLEHCMFQIFEDLAHLLTTRTMSDSLKALTLFRTVLNYLKEYNYGEENTKIESVINVSLNQIVDNLQSDEIAERAMAELKTAQFSIDQLNLEIQALQNERSVSKGSLLSELEKSKKDILAKESLIGKLEKELYLSNQQRKNDRKKLEQAAVHKVPKLPTRANSLSVFEHLKNQTVRHSHQKLPRQACLSKSSKFLSLKSVIDQQPEAENRNRQIPDNAVPLNNSDDEIETESSSSKSPSIDELSYLFAKGRPVSNDYSGHYALHHLGSEGQKQEIFKSTATATSIHFPEVATPLPGSKPAPSNSQSHVADYEPSIYTRRGSTALEAYSNDSQSPSAILTLSPPAPPPLPPSLQNAPIEPIATSQSIVQPVAIHPKIPPPPPPLPVSLLGHESSVPVPNEGLKKLAAPPPPPPPPPLPLALSTKKVDIELNGLASGTSQQNVPKAPPPSHSIGTDKVPQSTGADAENSDLKLKQIHWDKLEDVSETIWSQEGERQDAARHLESSGFLEEIAELFRVNQSVPMRAKSETSSAVDKVSILPRDIAQQFGINLHMFSNLSVEEFVNKVLHCDREVIGNQSVLEFFAREDLSIIPRSIASKLEPYSTDYQSNKVPLSDCKKLERADRIFLELCYNLRSYWRPRSLCLLTLSTYEKDYFDLIYKLQRVDDAINIIKNSVKLKDTLMMIIEIGNYMNRKQAGGIRLSSLQKLTFVKSSKDKNMSLLHAVERFLRVKCRGAYGFVEDLSRVLDLGNLMVGQIEQDFHEYIQRITGVKQSLEQGRLSNPEHFHPEDRLLIKVGPKIAGASRKANLLRNQFVLTMRALENLMKLYGEDPVNVDSKNEFFQHFINFVSQFKKVARENEEKEAVERIYMQRKELLQNRSKDNTSSSQGGASEGEDNTVDNLIKRLREVNKNEKNSQRRSANHNSEDLLFTRTQHLLDSIQKI